ncbi:type I-E CRISPR-associated protein Cse1/CasA [Methylomonas paludis]|uniref:Type I-E CRISPR-associated protein Cse1/CasA n=1 Tax=Methylomonas paludis TaxID=1173101 RepID=A0A975MNJ4_9GAMM|nr:type I-E CRISPR-associated protein Cse1/CasA [Methylomonas paludis]QWF70614.1 type I-E CRISPR-associated protein Cse1/CasA [Methylomonas paludis]
MSRFNLLEQAWIPVKGRRELIKVCEIVHPDILGVDAPRADFNAALMQFLIGLLQTVFAPETPRAWRIFYSNPPTEAELQTRLDTIKEAFYLDGDGYRFMQDNLAKEVGKCLPIEEMIFGAPGDSGKEGNKDHFTKRNDISGLCFSCSSIGLLAANLFAEDGGQSYYPAMRGNGFISNLVCLDEATSVPSLWKNVWLNVLENSKQKYQEQTVTKNFLWLTDLPDKPQVEKLIKIKTDLNNLKKAKKVTKYKQINAEIDEKIKPLEKEQKSLKEELDDLGEGKIIFPDDKNVLQVYWAWMRRFLLDTENSEKKQCSICHANTRIITKFYKKNKGYKYSKEHWQDSHPFSPTEKYERTHYNSNNEKYKDKMLALNMPTNGLPYNYWQDFLRHTTKNSPAKVVINHLKNKNSDSQLVIFAFGYAMDSNTPLGWYESKTPLYFIDDESNRSQFEAEVEKLISASNKIANAEKGYLVNAIKLAWFNYNDMDEINKKPKDRKRDPFIKDPRKSKLYDQPINISRSFMNSSESKFYLLLKALYSLANEDKLTEESLLQLKKEWYFHLKYLAEVIFEQWAFKSSIQTNPRRISIAHKQLMRNLTSKSLKQDTLGLTKENSND